MGLVILGAAALYLVLAIFVVSRAISHARKEGKNVKRWGWGAALMMYLIPFWDWIPTVAMHEYYCATEAGFWVYKTPEQWRTENPGLLESMANTKDTPHRHDGDAINYTNTFFLNQRINWIVRHQGKLFPNRWRHEQELVDTVRGEVLGRYVDFSTSQEPRQAGWTGWKLWLDSTHCGNGKLNDSLMWQFTEKFKGAKK